MNTPIGNQQVEWYESVYLYVAPFLDEVGEWPTIGTVAWRALDDDDPRKIAAILDASQHWALRLETGQIARCGASRDISAAEDWTRVGTELVQHRSFYAARPWLRRRPA